MSRHTYSWWSCSTLPQGHRSNVVGPLSLDKDFPAEDTCGALESGAYEDSMKKAAKKTVGARNRSAPKKRAAAKPVRATPKKISARVKKPRSSTVQKTAKPSGTSGKLSFNHAMIYLRDVQGGIAFYRDWLGFHVIEDFRHEGKSVYARLLAPAGDGTIALHQAAPGGSVASDGVRLYFEVPDLDGFCQKMRKKGFYFTQPPQVMPWGWRHAYLNDPEGHEISLYWAGDLRMKKTVTKSAEQSGNQ